MIIISFHNVSIYGEGKYHTKGLLLLFYRPIMCSFMSTSLFMAVGNHNVYAICDGVRTVVTTVLEMKTKNLRRHTDCYEPFFKCY